MITDVIETGEIGWQYLPCDWHEKRPSVQWAGAQWDEDDLMQRVAGGEADALECLLGAHWQAVFHYASDLLGCLDEAEDVTQEAFVRLWAYSAKWRPRGCVRAFLYRVTRNLALNERRRARVRAHWVQGAAQDMAGPETPTQVLEAAEIRTAIDEAVTDLPERRREVFVLARYQQMSHREIAESMGISVQTVANQMSAALATLRMRLKPYLDDAVHCDERAAS